MRTARVVLSGAIGPRRGPANCYAVAYSPGGVIYPANG